MKEVNIPLQDRIEQLTSQQKMRLAGWLATVNYEVLPTIKAQESMGQIPDHHKIRITCRLRFGGHIVFHGICPREVS